MDEYGAASLGLFASLWPTQEGWKDAPDKPGWWLWVDTADLDMDNIAYVAGIVWIPESDIAAGVDVEPGIRLLRLPDSVPQTGHAEEVRGAMADKAEPLRIAKLFGHLTTFGVERIREGYRTEEIIEAMRQYVIAGERAAEARGGRRG